MNVVYAAVWYAATGPIIIGALAGIALGLLIRKAMNYFSLIRMVGVRSPIAIMEVGGTDQTKAQLFYKPRYTTQRAAPVNGTITFYKDSNTGIIYDLSNAGASHTLTAAPTATETLTGVQVGMEILSVSGSDIAGIPFDPMGVEVHVVANQPDSITFYRLAIQLAIQWWLTGALGNLRININSHPPAGLCDEWMDWAADWLQFINKGDICKIEKCLSPNGSHNYLRITMCDETVFYLDPWIRPSDPVFGKDEYEDEHSSPGDAYVYWER
jgi:hypothetical protein